VTAVNSALSDEPAQINTDPMGAGWFIQIRPSDPAELDQLMDETAYQALIGA
jgi:glycine cleavage system H protein